MKRIVFIILSFLMILNFAGCSDSQNKELYRVGLDLISVMDEMIGSEEYSEMIGGKSFKSLVQTVDTGDYNLPIGVYRIDLPEAQELLKLLKVSDLEDWNRLSENLKKQIENKVSFSAIISILNAKKGSEYVAFSSVYTAMDKNTKFKIEKPVVLLYVFEKGEPIAVTFSETGSVSGQFLFLDEIKSDSEIKEFFKEYKCSVSKIY